MSFDGTTGLFAGQILSAANTFGLDPGLLACLIMQESQGVASAARWERPYWIKRLRGKRRADLAGWLPALGSVPSLEDELLWRSHSFGLMQVLGETSRSQLGFKGQYLHETLDVDINLALGCTYLRKLVAKNGGDQTRALEDYNGSAAYPGLVYRWATDKRTAQLIGRDSL